MDINELINLASPPCPQCGAVITHTEITHALQEQQWVIDRCTTICANGCRSPVEPL
jgi:hypothetical protein